MELGRPRDRAEPDAASPVARARAAFNGPSSNATPRFGPDAAPAADDAVLSVEDLSVTFPSLPAGQSLIDGVSLRVGRGRTLGIVGESGCGKSLVSLAVMGLLGNTPARVTGGRILFEGRDVLPLREAERAELRGDRMAMIFQEPMTALNPAFTVGEQIAEGVRRHRGASRAEARAAALDALRQVRMADAEARLDAYPHQLSGGMRQRAMIAMALVNRPTLLIADEPTTALDVTIQAQVLRLVRDLQGETGAAMILVTHDLGVVAEVADEVAVMYAGRVVEQGPVAAVFDDPQHPYTLGLLGSLPSLAERRGRLAAIPGAVPPPARWPQGCRFASRCPFSASECLAERPALRPLGLAAGAGHAAACVRAPVDDIPLPEGARTAELAA